MLRIAHAAPIALDPAQQRFLDVLAYYAALGVERVHLVAEAERAEALRQADELKDALIAGVSHDLRTPFTTIKAVAHQLAGRGDPDAASIEEEADRLNRFVADLLDLSRLNAGALPMHLELNSADDLVGAVVHQLRVMLGGRELRVHRAPESPILFGTFDLVQSLRVLANLVENALKYAPPTAPVELFVERHGDALVLVDPVHMQEALSILLTEIVNATPAEGEVGVTVVEVPQEAPSVLRATPAAVGAGRSRRTE